MVDSIVVQSAVDNTEDPKHIEAMVAAVDSTEAALQEESTPSTEGDRPEWLPEKFKTPEELAKAYSELEGKLGTNKPDEKPAGVTEADPKTAEEAPNAADAEAVLEDKGLSLDEFSQEYADKGALSDASYAKLEKAGIARSVVDQYIAGQTALATQLQTEVKSVVGGDENFTAMATWAAANADPKTLEAYNAAVSSGDVAQAKLAINGLYQQFRDASPEEPNLLTGGNGKVTADVYESVQQLQADMAKPEYKKDPAYRRKVQEKLGRSDIL